MLGKIVKSLASIRPPKGAVIVVINKQGTHVTKVK